MDNKKNKSIAGGIVRSFENCEVGKQEDLESIHSNKMVNKVDHTVNRK